MIFDNTSVTANGKAEPRDDVVYAVSGDSGIVDTSVTLTDHHAKGFDIFTWDVAFPPDVDLIVKGEKPAVQHVGLSLSRTGYRGIDYGRVTFPCHAYGHMVVRSRLHEIMQGFGKIRHRIGFGL